MRVVEGQRKERPQTEPDDEMGLAIEAEGRA